MSVVDFFIVGAPKCGTTSLHRYLEAHPDIFMSTPKETNFFSRDELERQGLYYQEKRIEQLEDYEALFEEAKSGRVSGEASVSYLFYPTVAEKIKSYNPDAKIIILLRNPVDRAFSHYLMDLRLGYCRQGFEDVFRSGSGLFFQQYFELGLYYQQVKKYVEIFGRDNVAVLFDSDLKKFPKAVVDRICLFLGLSKGVLQITERRHNEYKEPVNSVVAGLYKIGRLRRLIQVLLPRSLSSSIKARLFHKSNKPMLTEELKLELETFYRDDLIKLREFLNEDCHQLGGRL